jgi:energy-coupling factor transporter ATP-binding protein EcfA2
VQLSSRSEPATVRFRFKNIGPVREAELELGDLTVVAGRNNTGKTYIAYTLYGFLKSWKDQEVEELAGSTIESLAAAAMEKGQARLTLDMETLNRERRRVIGVLAEMFSRNGLHGVFSSRRDAFKGASIEVDVGKARSEYIGCHEASLRPGGVLSLRYDGQEIIVEMSKVEGPLRVFDVANPLSRLFLQFLFPELSSNPFVLSAERFGISLFRVELDFTKNNLVDLLQKIGDDKDRGSPLPFLFIDKTTSRYALPIKDNIDYTRSTPDLKEKSQVYGERLFDRVSEMMGGHYRGSGEGDIRFASRRRDGAFDIPLHRASSSVRGLSDLYFFLRRTAEKDHLLIIDEPESHLDTANQRLLARLLTRLTRAGLKVLITTHSDYLIKEVNNLVMLSRPFQNRRAVARRLKYRADDFIEPDSIRAYVADGGGLTRCKVDEFGIDMPMFDETIDDINRAANELSSRVAEERE